MQAARLQIHYRVEAGGCNSYNITRRALVFRNGVEMPFQTWTHWVGVSWHALKG